MSEQPPQAEFVMEIPDVQETFPTIYIVTALYTGRGPANGSRKIFQRPYLTQGGAEKAAKRLSKDYKKRRIYALR